MATPTVSVSGMAARNGAGTYQLQGGVLDIIPEWIGTTTGTSSFIQSGGNGTAAQPALLVLGGDDVTASRGTGTYTLNGGILMTGVQMVGF